MKKFNAHSTVVNQLHERQQTTLTPHVLATIHEKLTANPSPLSRSLRRVMKEEGLLYGTAIQ